MYLFVCITKLFYFFPEKIKVKPVCFAEHTCCGHLVDPFPGIYGMYIYALILCIYTFVFTVCACRYFNLSIRFCFQCRYATTALPLLSSGLLKKKTLFICGCSLSSVYMYTFCFIHIFISVFGLLQHILLQPFLYHQLYKKPDLFPK